MALVAGIQEPVEYPMTLTISPPEVPISRDLDFSFRVFTPGGKPVSLFEEIHEKLFHQFIISQDLTYFAHVHPEPHADGSFLLHHRLPKPGYYRLLSDFYPHGGTPQLLPKTIATKGYSGPLLPAAIQPDLSPQKGENLTVELTTEPAQPIVGKKTLLFCKLTPAEGLEPYLGAWAHLLAASSDLIDTIHGHPSIADGGPQVQFDLFFPREGVYRVWIQFQRQGVVNTVAFNIPVSVLK